VSEDNTSVLSVGYNGDEAGGPGIPDSLEPGKSNFVHAEINAGLKLDYNFPKKKIMYVTHFPCRTCCRAIVNMGISTVVYDDVYRDMSGKEILERSNVEVRCIKELCHECDFRFEAKLLTV
jgi:dCMP deaminase